MGFSSANTLKATDAPLYISTLLGLNITNKPFLSKALAKNGIAVANQSTYDMSQVFDIGVGSQTGLSEDQVVTGVAASTISRALEQNNIQLFQSIVNVSTLRQSVTTGLTGINGEGNEIDPLTFQVQQALAKFQSDWDYSALNGARLTPALSSNPYQMGGVLNAVKTAAGSNYVDLAAAALTAGAIDTVLANLANAGCPMGDMAIVCNPLQKAKITALFQALNSWNRQSSDTTAGVYTEYVNTNFGRLEIITDSNVLNGAGDNKQIGIVDMSMIRPVYLPAEGQDILVKPLSATGASDKYLVYGQLGIDYGSVGVHALIVDFT